MNNYLKNREDLLMWGKPMFVVDSEFWDRLYKVRYRWDIMIHDSTMPPFKMYEDPFVNYEIQYPFEVQWKSVIDRPPTPWPETSSDIDEELVSVESHDSLSSWVAVD